MMDWMQKNWVMVLGIVVAVETQIGNGSMSLANMFPELWIPYVKAWAANLGSMGALIVAAGSRQQTNAMATMAKVVVVGAIVFLALGGGEARAQVKKPQITGDIVADTKANFGATSSAANPTGTKLGDSGCKATGDPIADLHCVIKAGGAKLILHLKQSYALASAPGTTGPTTADNTSAMCTKALVPIVNLVVNGPPSGAVAAGDPMALTPDEVTLAATPGEPDGPIVIVEKIRILRLAIQSPALNDACGALVQDEVKNAQSLVGKVTSLITGAGILAPLGL
jgi:hypothetical protein